jgi:hypothetical protein
MPRALFVNLRQLYPQLVIPVPIGTRPQQYGAALRNCTCGWWNISPAAAGGVEFLFGVHERRVVSAYHVRVPVADWPRMPHPAEASGRRYVPVDKPVSASLRAQAASWMVPFFGAPVRYGTVQLDQIGFAEPPRFDRKKPRRRGA